MKEGNDWEYVMEGGIGFVAFWVIFEGLIVEECSSFIVFVWWIYVFDLVQFFFNSIFFVGMNYYFYDFNVKVNYWFSDEDCLYFSIYFGRDVLQFWSNVCDFNFDMFYGNVMAILCWNYLFSDKLFMNVFVIYNDYDFGFSGGQGDFRIGLEFGVCDWNGKVDFEYFLNFNYYLRFGVNYIYYWLILSLVMVMNGDEVFGNEGEICYVYESVVYFVDEMKIGLGICLNVGFCVFVFMQFGFYILKQDSIEYVVGELVKIYIGVEFWLVIIFYFNVVFFLKVGVMVVNQYLYLVSNFISILFIDIWMFSLEIIKF